jgi:hypothetical protein
MNLRSFSPVPFGLCRWVPALLAGIALAALTAPNLAKAQIFLSVDASTDLLAEYSLGGSPIYPVSSPLDAGLSAPQEIAYSGGQLFVTEDSGGNTVGKFSATAANSGTNTFITSPFGSGNTPISIVSSGSDLYVGTTGGNVYEFTTAGANVLGGTSALVSGLGSGNISLAITGNALYVADNAGSGLLKEYNATTGAAVGTFSAAVPGNNNIRGLAIIGSTLYATDPTAGTGMVYEYATTGTGQTASTGFSAAAVMAIAAYNNNLYLANLTASPSVLQSVTEYSATGISEGTVISNLPGDTYTHLSVIPEPSTYAAALGAAALAVAAIRRRRKAA